jgi:ABC-type transport system substrate-binding protein
MEAIKARGYKIHSDPQPHVWPWQLSFLPGSPWLDKRVRYAANLCVNRTALKQLLGGMMSEATDTFEPGDTWRGNPTFEIKYDPDAARKLMQETGYSAAKPPKVKVQVSASGSGQMQPLPMNEFIQ